MDKPPLTFGRSGKGVGGWAIPNPRSVAVVGSVVRGCQCGILAHVRVESDSELTLTSLVAASAMEDAVRVGHELHLNPNFVAPFSESGNDGRRKFIIHSEIQQPIRWKETIRKIPVNARGEAGGMED
jgi:hypothetical protein